MFLHHCSDAQKYYTLEALNKFNPLYTFNTDGIVAITDSSLIAQNSMDVIRAVPNPYYGYSSYENNQLDNRIKNQNGR